MNKKTPPPPPPPSFLPAPPLDFEQETPRFDHCNLSQKCAPPPNIKISSSVNKRLLLLQIRPLNKLVVLRLLLFLFCAYTGTFKSHIPSPPPADLCCVGHAFGGTRRHHLRHMIFNQIHHQLLLLLRHHHHLPILLFRACYWRHRAASFEPA